MMTRGMEHCDDKGMEQCDGRGHGALKREVSWSIVLTGGMDHCDDMGHGAV